MYEPDLRFSFAIVLASSGCGSTGQAAEADTDEPTTTSAASTSSDSSQGTSSTSEEPSATSDATATTRSASTGGGESAGAETSTGQQEDSTGSGATTGGSTLPIDCDDGDLPVRVDGGGVFATVGEGVVATPPGGTLWICPGNYAEQDPISIRDDINIVGAGRDLVNIATTAVFISGQSGGGGFEISDADATLEGFSLTGGRFGIVVEQFDGAPHTVTMRNLRVGESRDAGIYLRADSVAEMDSVQAQLEDVIVENMTISPNVPTAGVDIAYVTTTFVDSVIRDNESDRGGLAIRSAAVTFEGGQVVRNEGLSGGGAHLSGEAPFPSSSLTIIDSDWGEGAASDNSAYDVGCGGGNNAVGLGASTNATCTNEGGACCVTSE